MSNGDDPRRFPFDEFFPPQPVIDVGEDRSFDPADVDIMRERHRAGLPAIPLPFPQPTPLPTPPFRPTIVPFPTGPAANDPVFRPAVSIGGAIIRGGVATVIFGTAIEILKELGSQHLEKEMREREADLEAARSKRKQQEPFRREIILPAPDVILDPNRVEFPRPRREIVTAPTQVPRPEFEPIPIEIPTPEFPQPDILPEPIAEPEISPAPRPAPRPAPTRAPRPKTIPTTSPLPGLFGLPRFFFVGRPLPSRFPQPRVRPDLTPFRPTVPSLPGPTIGSIQLPFQQPVPAPQTDPARRCKEVKRRRRRKGKCREGFYREFPGKTQFTEWREVNCATRAETRRSELRRKGFDVENVESFPKFGV